MSTEKCCLIIYNNSLKKWKEQKNWEDQTKVLCDHVKVNEGKVAKQLVLLSKDQAPRELKNDGKALTYYIGVDLREAPPGTHSAYNDEKKARAFFQKQASDYLEMTLVKGFADVVFPNAGDLPIDLARLLHCLPNNDEETAYRVMQSRMYGKFSGAIKEKCIELAALPGSVLILGSSGVGKENVAHMIHAASCSKGQFVSVSLAAHSASILAAILFGVGKGVFTGVAPSKGLFEEADKGTLFLDEIADLDLVGQQHLLRVLAEGSFFREGEHGAQKQQLTCRIIAATNRVEELRTPEKFRQDLRMRLDQQRISEPEDEEQRTWATLRALSDPNVRLELPFLFAVELAQILRHWLGYDFCCKEIKIKSTIFDDLTNPNLSWQGNFRTLQIMARYSLMEALRALTKKIGGGELITLMEQDIKKKAIITLLENNTLSIEKLKPFPRHDQGTRGPVADIKKILLNSWKKNYPLTKKDFNHAFDDAMIEMKDPNKKLPELVGLSDAQINRRIRDRATNKKTDLGHTTKGSQK